MKDAKSVQEALSRKKDMETISFLKKTFEQVKVIDGVRSVPLRVLSKESGVKPLHLMRLIEENPFLFSVGKVKTKKAEPLHILCVYERLVDNPLTPEYLEEQKRKNEFTLKISYKDNYGHISGFYIEPSKGLELQYLNTVEKVKGVSDRFSLTPASYWIGGLGDSRLSKPEGGFNISSSQLDELVKDGWTIVGEYNALVEKEGGHNLDRSKLKRSEFRRSVCGNLDLKKDLSGEGRNPGGSYCPMCESFNCNCSGC